MRASVTLFRNLQHLGNYSILNYTGFVKICKKHDKSVAPELRLWAAYLESELETLPFVTQSGLDTLLRQLEAGYAAGFCDGNLQMGKAALLMRQSSEASAPAAALTLGLQLGGCAMLLVWTIWDVVIDVRVLQLRVDTHRQWMLLSLMLPVYRAGGAMVLMTFLWAGCLQAWKTARINYLYMFDLDQGSALSPTSALVLASRFGVVFLLSVLLVTKATLKELPHMLCVAPGIFPASMVLAMMGELLLPLRRARFAARSLGRVLAAPFCSVDLWASFVADVLTSMIKPMTDMAYSVCFLLHGEWLMPYEMQGGCAEWWFFSAVLKPLLCAFPLWCRFMQALRVYHDTHKRWPSLGNALKYAIAHLVVLFGVLHNPQWSRDMEDHPVDALLNSTLPSTHERGGALLHHAWVATYVTSTLYTFAWDVRIDWRLGDVGHGGLRERRMFNRAEWYYLAIVTDLVLRFGWTLTLVPGTQSVGRLLKTGDGFEAFWVIALAWLELLRRAMWAVFRLEAEHLHNTEGLRRVAIIPIHFDSVKESSAATEASSERRCGVLVELLAYALIVGLLATLVYCTRPHTFGAQGLVEEADYPALGALRGLGRVEPAELYVESY